MTIRCAGYEVHAMAAIGKPGRKEDLPVKLQEREVPNDRSTGQTVAEETGEAARCHAA
jgi:hypothetical protein